MNDDLWHTVAFSRRGNVIEASVDDEDPRRGDDHNHNDDDDDDYHDPDCEIILSGSQWSRGSDDVPILPHWRNAQPSSVCILSHVNIIIITVIITFIIIMCSASVAAKAFLSSSVNFLAASLFCRGKLPHPPPVSSRHHIINIFLKTTQFSTNYDTMLIPKGKLLRAAATTCDQWGEDT